MDILQFINYKVDFSIGKDCYDFAKIVRKYFNLNTLEKDVLYDLEERDKIFKDALKELIRLDNPQEGCYVLFSFRKDLITHLGIYIGDDKVIHATENSGVKIERLNRLINRKFFKGFYEHRRYISEN